MEIPTQIQVFPQLVDDLFGVQMRRQGHFSKGADDRLRIEIQGATVSLLAPGIGQPDLLTTGRAEVDLDAIRTQAAGAMEQELVDRRKLDVGAADEQWARVV